MIYSSVEDNWLRIELMFEIASKYNDFTKGEDGFDVAETDGKLSFRMDVFLMDGEKKESCLVGMLMVWSVVTLESLINHAIAESINNELTAKLAIEHPGQITEKIKPRVNAKSELAKKLLILNDDSEDISKLLEIAEQLSERRNHIVHDKPFDHCTDEDGEPIIKYFRVRGKELDERIRFKSLGPFFKQCDSVKEFIQRKSNLGSLDVHGKSFSGLLNDV
ncbi:MAG TPA: hypothetical protein PKD17_03350 [Cellvibrionaceae bacterium]|nr:hypothetical protein [Cellvibrionaceae bacterium]HMW70826.1 hypothetical protein [Cellvibrionaceae bacterium]HMY37825.1 hypothetical protein [Marinagarivorans sp.]HNB02508.1 hypothetical protein [Nitrosomonas sp.]HNG59467.1 hypothetical protein [Cellvibrionaceae bacterium]